MVITAKGKQVPVVKRVPYNPDRKHMSKADAVEDKKRLRAKENAKEAAGKKFDEEYASGKAEEVAEEAVEEKVEEATGEAVEPTEKKKTPSQIAKAKKAKAKKEKTGA